MNSMTNAMRRNIGYNLSRQIRSGTCRRSFANAANIQHATKTSTNPTIASSTNKDGGVRPIFKYSLIAAAGITATTAAIIKTVHDEVGGTDGLKRSVAFYSLAIPGFLKYKMHMMLDSPDEAFDKLNDYYSQKGLEKILELGGFYTKTGQMAAANVGDAFPKIWQERMSILQDQCPSKPFEVVKQIVEEDFGGKALEEVFDYFEKEPIGAASIGQVHRAVLSKEYGGKKVVVKVSYPEVEQLFRGDVRTIKLFAEVAQPVHVKPLEEIEKQFMTEFDYREEAIKMNTVRENLERVGIAGTKNLCVIPKPYLELCTKRVLVMDELEGAKLPAILEKDFEGHAKRAGVPFEEYKQQQEDKLKLLKQEGKDTKGPSAAEFDTYIKLIAAKRKANNMAANIHNWSLGLIPGIEKRGYDEDQTLPINHAKLIDDLIMIHGHQCLVDGYFNADPHPGNMMMLGLEKGKPQIGLIDYGQVKDISTEERLRLCKIVVALADDDKDSLVKYLAEAGYKSKNMDKEVIYKFAKVSYDEDNDEILEGMHMQVFLDDLEAKDPVSSLPEPYIMVNRTSVILRGLAHALRQPRSIAKAWKPIAQKVLESEQEAVTTH